MSNVIEVKVPDIGGFKDVPVIEVLVKPGDTVKPEDALLTLESDKATMEVPSPAAGKVKDVRIKVGDKVSEGSLVLTLESSGDGAAAAKPAPAPAPEKAAAASAKPQPAAAPPHPPALSRAEREASSAPRGAEARIDEAGFARAHASPSVRLFARELGVDLARVRGTGPKERVLREDIQNYVKGELARPRGAEGGAGLNLLPLPQVDFAKFGPVTTQPLSRIKKLTGANLHRNWVTIPHVTQHDEADITELEEFRKVQTEEAKKQGIRFTILCFLLKAVVVALKQHPEFNASLSTDGESLVLKQYFHIGVAVDTPNGLVVPVIRDVDKKGLMELAKELGDVSARMRAGKIAPTDIQGGCFSISSLGGLGGSHFTPIINAPEVAILGVAKSSMRPVWNGKAWEPRQMLPISVSYDHRVIDGAQGARFISFLSSVLSDIRRLVLLSSSAPIGVLGGTFDPVHYGHLRLAEELGETLKLDEVRLIPVGTPPHRGAPHVAAEHRLEMARIAAAGNPRFTVDDRELRRAGPGYTYDTLSGLRAEIGSARPLVLLLGADAFLEFATWHRWHEVFGLAHIAVAHRPGFPAESWGERMPQPLAREYESRLMRQPLATHLQPAGGIVVVSFTALDISATAIRDRIKAGTSPRYLLPSAVLDYIRSNGLYS